jgi:asparagine synthase (glutamine-hydrolysing)
VCGIGGILRIYPAGTQAPAPEASIPESWLDIIDESIRHRGPDGFGRFRDRARRTDGATIDVALVHRRLSIIDLAGGAQPMVSERGRAAEEGRVAVVFNGCIYNHRDLRKELQAAGHQFRTDHSDTEVLIHGWREWKLGRLSYCDLCDIFGGGLCSRLDGMFGFAIWDGGAGQLVLGRDQHGEKPLYYLGQEGGVHAFSSAAGGLMRLARRIGVKPTHANWDEWVREGYSTLLSPVRELRHGHTLVLGGVPESGTREEAEYEPAGSNPIDAEGLMPTWSRTHDLSIDELDPILERAVKSRLEADVPLGCFLSGGVDSSLVACYARRALGRLATFTVRMPAAAYDESPHAESVAKLIGAEHATLDCQARPAEDLQALIAQLGLPFGDSSLLPAYWVSRAARTSVKVALSGDGGDELFAGYERYAAAPLLGRWDRFIALLPARVFKDVDPKSRSSKVRRLIEAARGRGYEDLRAIFPQGLAERLGVRRGIRFMPIRGNDIGNAIRNDCSHYLPGDLMRKTDSASMSVALEVRAPMLSNGITAAAMSARISSLMPRKERKGLLRSVARRYLPSEIVDRPKMGFAIPVGDWFRTDYGGMKTLLLDHLNSADPWPNVGVDLNRRFVQQMLDEHMSLKRDHSQRLYMLLVLSIWAKAFLD